MSTSWIDFLFEDQETGEQFFVEVENRFGARDKAWDIAFDNFEDPELIGIYSPEDAELLGYDTY